MDRRPKWAKKLHALSQLIKKKGTKESTDGSIDKEELTGSPSEKPDLTPSQKEVLENYKDLERIQTEGSTYSDVIKGIQTESSMYSVVMKGTRRDDEKQLIRTIKIINIPEDKETEGVPANAIRQTSILKELEHPNVVRLLEVIATEEDVYHVFEYSTTCLHGFLTNPLTLTFAPHIKHVLRQILEGLAYCHAQKIIHRDLRPNNILLDSDMNVKISGFENAITFEVAGSSFIGDVGVPCYRAPEVLLGITKYTTAIDIWSVGLMLYEMAKRWPLFYGTDQPNILVQIFSLIGTPTEETWPGLSSLISYADDLTPSIKPKDLEKELFPYCELEPDGIDLLSKMLCLCPEHRISAEEALEHRFLSTSKTS